MHPTLTRELIYERRKNNITDFFRLNATVNIINNSKDKQIWAVKGY